MTWASQMPNKIMVTTSGWVTAAGPRGDPTGPPKGPRRCFLQPLPRGPCFLPHKLACPCSAVEFSSGCTGEGVPWQSLRRSMGT